MLVSEIYDSVTSDLLERGGFTLGLVSEDNFLTHYGSIHADFLQKTGIIRTIHCQPQQFGVDTYVLPDSVGDTKQAFSEETALFESSESDMASLNPAWARQIRQPRSWSQDKGKMTNIRISPAPRIDGSQVAVNGGALYGTASESPAGEVQVTCGTAEGLYGTIGGDNGSLSLIPTGPFFGTVAQFNVSKGNLAVIAQQSQFDQAPTLKGYVEWLPDSFALYIGYGILAKIFSTDGEMKNDQLARYCFARYEEGILLAQAISGETNEEAA